MQNNSAPSPHPIMLGGRSSCRWILAFACICLHFQHSIAFQRPCGAAPSPSALLVGRWSSRSPLLSLLPSSRDGDVSVRAAGPRGGGEGECEQYECADISRRDVFRRAAFGVGLALAASVAPGGSAGRANALDGMPNPNKKVGGLASKIRSVSKVMDELQRDLMQERWDLVEGYPTQLRSYVPVFTAYTDSAFPTDIPTDKGLRVALRYEVGRFFASLERFRQATSRKSLDEAYVAYSDMSLHFDRYLRIGGLYTFYDDKVSLESYYGGVPDASLVYADPKKDPALVRDLVVLIKGPEKGRTGIVIGIYGDGSGTCAVKLDRYRGIREIRVVSQEWAAKRLGEQDPDDVFLIPQSG